MLSVGNTQADSYLYIPTYLGTGYRMIIAQLLDTDISSIGKQFTWNFFRTLYSQSTYLSRLRHT